MVELDIDSSGEPQMFAAGTLRPGDWVWLDAGVHRIRVFTFNWMGLPQITAIRLDPPWAGQHGAFRVLGGRERTVTSIGKCRPLRVLSGGFGAASQLDIEFIAGGRVAEKSVVDVPASAEPQVQLIPVLCNAPGDFEARIALRGAPEQAGLRASETYAVFAPDSVTAGLRLGKVALEIDVADQPPDFGEGQSHVADTLAGRYRESSVIGATEFVRGLTTSESSWFAYRVIGLEPNQPYLFEVEYPDDADRVMVVAFQDVRETAYPTSFAIETGGVWSRSNRMAVRSVLVWPQSSDARVIVYNMHSGQRAAVSRIRFREVAIDNRPVDAARPVGREIAVWSEEGGSYRSLVGEAASAGSVNRAAVRYVELASLMGATMLVPTVSVYNFQLYPSRYNLAFQERNRDDVAALMLAGQQFGIRVMPELSPRADELVWAPRSETEMRRYCREVSANSLEGCGHGRLVVTTPTRLESETSP